MSSGIRPLDEEELAWYQGTIDGIYDDFVQVVCDGRGMEKAAVDSIAQGRVWSGVDALKIGLVDETGTLLDAVKQAAGRAGLRKYRIVAYPEKKNLLEDLMSSEKEKEHPLVRIREILPSGFSTIARMPYVQLDQH